MKRDLPPIEYKSSDTIVFEDIKPPLIRIAIALERLVELLECKEVPEDEFAG